MPSLADMMPRQVPKEAGPEPHESDVRISGASRLRRRLELWKTTLHEVEGQLRVVATADIEAGEIAFSSRAYATLLLPRNEKTYCAQCYAKFSEEKASKRCGGCKMARYCGSPGVPGGASRRVAARRGARFVSIRARAGGLDCQRAAWRGPHRVECKAFAKLREGLAGPDRDTEGEFLDAALASRTLRQFVEDERRGAAAGTEVVGRYTSVAPSVVDVGAGNGRDVGQLQRLLSRSSSARFG